MTARTVLISGGGIAGSTLAWWLGRSGFAVTVVERSAGLRSSGNPVDVRGKALEIAREMGALDELRAVATRVTTLAFVNGAGRVASVPMSGVAGGSSDDVEVARRDLAAVLATAAQRESDFLFDEVIASLAQDADGVDVTFRSGVRRRFDLVIGADGTHSSTRQLVFGADSAFVEHLGLYVATVPLAGPVPPPVTGPVPLPLPSPLPASAVDASVVMNHNEPGRLLTVHPANGTPIAAFIFRHAPVAGFDHRDLAQHRRIVTDAYAGGGWRTRELLEVVAASPDLYFDAVSRVRIPSWARGRVALVGDAASSVSLFGEGSSMAMIGAKTLADALAETPDDYTGAFARYERAHRVRVDPLGRNVAATANFLVPKTRAGIVLRDAAVRAIGLGLRMRTAWAERSRRRAAAGAGRTLARVGGRWSDGGHEADDLG